MKPLRDRLMDKVEFIPECGCWIFTGCTMTKKSNRLPYGKILYNRESKLAHRISWEIFKGPIPKRKCVLHFCDTPQCVNPDHLFIGTHTDNMHDMIKKGRLKKVIKDVSGKKFGEWTVLGIKDKQYGKGYYFDCVCSCGNRRLVAGNSLRLGKSKSCGCSRRSIKKNSPTN